MLFLEKSRVSTPAYDMENPVDTQYHSPERNDDMRTFSSSSRAVNISNPSTRPRTNSSSSRAVEVMPEEESEYNDVGDIEALENVAIAEIANLMGKFIFLRKIL